MLPKTLTRSHRLLLWLLAAPLAGCSEFANRLDTFKLQCGKAPTAGFRYVDASVSNPAQAEAVAIEPEGLKSLALVGNGCIEVPETFQGQVLVRDGTRGWLIEPKDQRFWVFGADKSSAIDKSQRILSCAQDAIVSKGTLSLQQELRVTDQYRYTLHVGRLFRGEELLKEFPLDFARTEWSLPVEELQDGDYELAIDTIDAFETARGGQALRSVCRISLDRQAPVVTADLASLPFYDEGQGIVQTEAGQALNFRVEDSQASQLLVCLKQRQEEDLVTAPCQKDEYRPSSRTLTTPEQGIWDLSYYAEDAAGNRSSPQTHSFAVFNSDGVESTKRLLLLSQNQLLARNETEATNLFRQGLREFFDRELSKERDAIRNELLQTAWRIHEAVEQKAVMPLPLPADRSVANFYVQGQSRLALLDDLGKLQIIQSGRELVVKDKVVALAQSDKSTLWWLESDGKLWYLSASSEATLAFQFTEDILSKSNIEDRRFLRLSIAPTDKAIAVVTNTRTVLLQQAGQDFSPTKQWEYAKARQVAKGAGLVFNDEGSHVFVKFPWENSSKIESIRLDRLSEVKTQTLPAGCFVTSLAPGLRNELYFFVADDRVIGTVSVACQGLNVWQPNLPDTALIHLSGQLGLQYTNQSEIARLGRAFAEIVVFANLTDTADVIRLRAEDGDTLSAKSFEISRIAHSRSEKIQRVSSDSQGRWLVIQSDRDIEIRPLYPFDREIALAYRSLDLASSQRIAFRGEEELLVVQQNQLRVFALEDRLLGTKRLTQGLQALTADAESRGEPSFFYQAEPWRPGPDGSGLSLIFEQAEKTVAVIDSAFSSQRKRVIDFIPTAMDLTLSAAYLVAPDKTLWRWDWKKDSLLPIGTLPDVTVGVWVAANGRDLLLASTAEYGKNKLLRMRVDNNALKPDIEVLSEELSTFFVKVDSKRRYALYDSVTNEQQKLRKVYDLDKAAVVWQRLSTGEFEAEFVESEAVFFQLDGQRLVKVELKESGIQESETPLTVDADLRKVIPVPTTGGYLLQQGDGTLIYTLRGEDKILGRASIHKPIGCIDDFVYFAINEKPNLLLFVSLRNKSKLEMVLRGGPLLIQTSPQLLLILTDEGDDPSASRRYLERLSLDPQEIRQRLDAWLSVRY